MGVLQLRVQPLLVCSLRLDERVGEARQQRHQQADATKNVEDRQQLAGVGVGRKIAIAHSRQADRREIEAVKIRPALNPVEHQRPHQEQRRGERGEQAKRRVTPGGADGKPEPRQAEQQ